MENLFTTFICCDWQKTTTISVHYLNKFEESLQQKMIHLHFYMVFKMADFQKDSVRMETKLLLSFSTRFLEIRVSIRYVPLLHNNHPIEKTLPQQKHH